MGEQLDKAALLAWLREEHRGLLAEYELDFARGLGRAIDKVEAGSFDIQHPELLKEGEGA